jgi:antitoxin HicB
MTETEVSSEIERLRGLPYTYVLRQEEDRSWLAQIKELRGCMTVGDSRDGALEMLDDALVSWLEAALEDGVAIPEPEGEPVFSGRFVIRVAHSMHRNLSERAEREGVSLNSLVVSALAAFLGQGWSAGPSAQAFEKQDSGEALLAASYISSVAGGAQNPEADQLNALASWQSLSPAA